MCAAGPTGKKLPLDVQPHGMSGVYAASKKIKLRRQWCRLGAIKVWKRGDSTERRTESRRPCHPLRNALKVANRVWVWTDGPNRQCAGRQRRYLVERKAHAKPCQLVPSLLPTNIRTFCSSNRVSAIRDPIQLLTVVIYPRGMKAAAFAPAGLLDGRSLIIQYYLNTMISECSEYIPGTISCCAEVDMPDRAFRFLHYRLL